MDRLDALERRCDELAFDLFRARQANDELERRLDALERRLTLADLPLAALFRKLEADWQPNATILLGESSITPAMLARGDA